MSRYGRRGSGQLTWYRTPERPAEPEPEPEPRPDALWGWTLAGIHNLARAAAMANRWLVSDFTIRYEAAWDGIVDELLNAESRPEAHDLARAGKGAVSRALLKDFCHTYGVAERDLTAGIGSAPRFAAYWFERGHDGIDERVTERIALGQVMEAIGPRHRRFLEALAAAPDIRSAADTLGIPRSSLTMYLSQARRAFERLWYSPDTPPQRKRKPYRYSPSEWNMSRLAPCGTAAAYERHKSNGEEIDEACAVAYTERNRAKRAKRRRGRHEVFRCGIEHAVVRPR